jgi:ribosomal protein L40E
MVDFNGALCPVCENIFNELDDIVVCPKCGTPCHRSCYLDKGSCIHENKHEENFIWSASSKIHDKQKVLEEKICPICFNKNASDAVTCSRCEANISEKTPVKNNKPGEENLNEDNFTNFLTPGIFLTDPLGNVDPEEIIEGITAKDIAKYVQSNTNYYIPIFKNIGEKNKSKFNFSAFLFSGAWFFYRKQYKLGSIFALTTVLLLIFFNLIYYFYTSDIKEKIFKSLEISSSIFLTPSQYIMLKEKLFTLPLHEIILYILPNFLLLLIFILMIICGFIGNRRYLKTCLEQINKIKSQSKSESEYNRNLAQNGGIDQPTMWCCLACFLILFTIPF